MRFVFTRGPLFYAEFNIRLLIFILFKKSGLLVSNDLDTLVPNWIAHKIKRIPLVYDTHEYFTGVPELVGRPCVQSIWKAIERSIFPCLKTVVTVNKSIAQQYNAEYRVACHVVRNIGTHNIAGQLANRNELGLPPGKIIILQGNGINIQRGAEEAVEAMQWVNDATLIIVGDGDVIPQLKQQAKEQHLEHKVLFIPRQPPDRLIHYTRQASIGLTLDKNTNLNYQFSLPNKLFDYINAGVPVLASRLPEIERIVAHYGIGDFIETHDPRHIAHKINSMFANDKAMHSYRQGLVKAASELTWENEEKILLAIFQSYV